MLELELNKNISFFFIPNLFHLSFSNPGPIQLDNSKLTDQQKKIILSGVLTGKILCKKDGISITKEVVLAQTKSKSELAVSPKEEATEILKKAQEARDQLRKDATILLTGPPLSVIKKINSIDNIGLIQECISLEKRSKVLEALKSRSSSLIGIFQKEIGDGLKPTDLAYKEIGPNYEIEEE